MLILVTIVSGGIFAQTDFESVPKNTVVVDIGPTIAGLTLGSLIDAFTGEGVKSSGFGIGAQYERQILENLAVAGRFAYMGVGFGIGDSFEESGVTVKTEVGINLDTISVEAHARFYPSGEVFFLGGMLGFGSLSLKFYGDIAAKDRDTGEQEKLHVEVNASRGYFKLGARIGWRINFGRQGGFTFEPSLGYDFAFGIGDTMGTALQKEVEKIAGEDVDADMSEMDELFYYLENFLFVGGPRLTLAFGWRF
jgi:hypothetical protein